MLHFGFSLTPFGHNPSAWKVSASRDQVGFDALLRQVMLAERVGFDFVLLADRMGQASADSLSPLATPFEPTTLVSALSTQARDIGFLAAAVTDRHEPYNLARRFASLDWISRGRTGWVALAGSDEARDREYLEVVGGLWESWEDDAFIHDKAAGRFFVPGKMHVLNHKGAYFTVRGPLNVNRSPQGRPVIAQILTDRSGPPPMPATEVVIVADATAAANLVLQMGQAGRRRAQIRIFQTVTDFAGPPGAVADTLQQQAETGDLDGFVLSPPDISEFTGFVETVVPELQRRQMIRTGYSGATLREHLGLPHPAHPASQEDAR